jgi:hypothetical protein
MSEPGRNRGDRREPGPRQRTKRPLLVWWLVEALVVAVVVVVVAMMMVGRPPPHGPSHVASKGAGQSGGRAVGPPPQVTLIAPPKNPEPVVGRTLRAEPLRAPSADRRLDQNPTENPFAQTDDGLQRSTSSETPAAAPRAASRGDGAAGALAADRGDQTLIDLYKEHKLLSKSEYATIRRVFARRFEKAHDAAIRTAFGEPGSPLRKWLDARPEVKEEFYLAIDPEHDDVPRALALFKELHHRFPEKLEDYANLAIAISVVWDREAGAIHGGPIGGSILPEGQMGPIENFQYYVDTEQEMQGRIRYMPWEFLVYVVNHRTTLPERKWALLSYLPKRTMIGKCYGDVPYDYDSLKGEPSRIAGKLHTLPNQLLYGGQCGCQSDYAARIAKSLGVPAASADGHTQWSSHVWVVWAELGTVTPTGFHFSFEAESRHAGTNDVGHTMDPHTGLPSTDRQMELRLHTVGRDPVAKRQAELVMRAYPMLRKKLKLDIAEQLGFLSRLLKFCPGNEEAWKTLARMSREGRITRVNKKPMQRALSMLFVAFRNLPDFTWTVFDDMVSFEDRPLERAALYARLAAMYEQANRVDLSCEARLKHAALLQTADHTPDAMASLATAILLFVDNQRYVPLMLDGLDSLSKGDKRSQEWLVRFYQQFLPKISRSLGDPGSYKKNCYCADMYKRGAEKFEQAGLRPLAESCRAQAKLLAETHPEKKKNGRPTGEVIAE